MTVISLFAASLCKVCPFCVQLWEHIEPNPFKDTCIWLDCLFLLRSWHVNFCQLCLTFTERSVLACFCTAGSVVDRFTVFCSSAQELQEWLEHLQPFTKGGSPVGTISKVSLHTNTHTHTNSKPSKHYQKWTLQHSEVWKALLIFHRMF